MSVDDYQINATVRRILARCWVDLASLRFGTVGRTVYFHGSFLKVRPARPSDTDPWGGQRPEEVSENLVLLELVEKEIRRERSVADVVFQLDNFRKTRGKWSATGV